MNKRPDDIMERARRNKALADAVQTDEAQMAAFLETFDKDWTKRHPDKTNDILREMRARPRTRR